MAAIGPLVTALLLLLGLGSAQKDAGWAPCPLIGAYFPPPTIDASSSATKSLAASLTKTFDSLIQNGGDPKYGTITPNSTSFSVVLFSGSDHSASNPAFFNYQHTASGNHTKVNVTGDTQMPIGELTMVFTVYTWLIKMGHVWDSPITTFLPELRGAGSTPWDDITIGALAGHLSGLPRNASACAIGGSCDSKAYIEEIRKLPPIFLPDTTPMISYAAFQLLAFALERRRSSGFASVAESAIFHPLGLSGTSFLKAQNASNLHLSRPGEPAAISLASTTNDLAKVGSSILSAQLISAASTRRWLRPSVDTSNLRNGVGRPWEVYRAGQSPISPILPILTKSGALGPYASYFGISTDFNVGFAILAKDETTQDTLDLNVYVDVISDSIGSITTSAAKETAVRFAGTYKANDSMVAVNITENGPGLEVQRFQLGGEDQKQKIADKLGIALPDLDFRLYPSNVKNASSQQFVAVFQDKSAPVDAGTPTCITWQTVGQAGVEYRYVFQLGDGKQAKSILVGKEILLRGS